MFGLSFLSPLFLAGLAAASLPIIIHLLTREKPKVLRFSSLRFISESHQENIKRHRLKELILLLMRMAIFALLALAFSQPFFAKNPSFIPISQKRNAVLILDNSYSMEYLNRFSEAKRRAIEIVKSLKAQDKAAVIVVSNFPQVAYELSEISEKREAIIAAIQVQKLSYNLTSYPGAIKMAEQILKPIKGESKEIYLISDLQKLGWKDFVETDRISSEVKLNLIDLSQKGGINLALTALKFARTTLALAKAESSKLIVRVSNFGPQSARGIEASLMLDDKLVSQKSVDILPNDFSDASFDFRISDAKAHYGYATLDSDNLKSDNIRYFSIQNFGGIKVHCVDGESGKRAEENESFYVAKALNPGDKSSPLAVSASAYLPKDLDGYDAYDAIALLNLNLNAGAFSTQDVERLKNFVNSGGGLIVALGDKVNANSYNTFFNQNQNSRSQQPLLPGNLVSIQGDAKNRETFSVLANVDYNHPIFSIFKEPGHGDFTAVKFYSHFQVLPLREAVVFGRYDNGEAAFLERNYGSGRVVLITSTLDSEWNDFPKHGVFLPFIHEMVKYVSLKKSDQKDDYIVGDQILLKGFKPKEELTLEREEGKGETESKNIKKIKMKSDGEGSISIDSIDVSSPGVYKLSSESSESKERFFTVNLDARESNIASRNADEVKSMLIRTNVGANVGAELASAQSQERQASEKNQQVWWYLIFLTLLLAIAEITLANRIS